MFKLNYPLITGQGIIEDVLNQKIIPGRPSPLHLSKKKLKEAYFPALPKTISDEEIRQALNSDIRFMTLPHLKQVIHTIFSLKDTDNLMEVFTSLQTPLVDWSTTTAPEQFQILNTRYGYFNHLDQQQMEALQALFIKVSTACHTMAVLFDENKSLDDSLAYDYAYKLMAIFLKTADITNIAANEQKLFDEISKKTYALLTQVDSKKNNPLYDTLFVKLKLPVASDLHDRDLWIDFIEKTGERSFEFLTIAKEIKDKNLSVPKTIEEAKEMAVLCKYDRAGEDDYDLRLMSTDLKMKMNSVYLSNIGGKIAYSVITPSGENIINQVTNINAPNDFSLMELNKQKKAILNFTFNKGHTGEYLGFAKLCYNYNVDVNIFNQCLDYIGSPPNWPRKTTDSIPSLTIKGVGVMEGGKDIADGYYWLKLPINDKRALILGKITDCCQSIGNHSSHCVRDAVSLQDNGLYVLLKHKRGDKSKPMNDDGSINYDNFQIIGQSYVWKSQLGNVCLDSIECLKNSVPMVVLKKILSDFSRTLLTEHDDIKRVTVGRGGKTPKDLFEETAIPEIIRQGYQYADADEQYCIQKGQRKLDEAQIKALDAWLEGKDETFIECVNYLSDYVVDSARFSAQLSKILLTDPLFTAVLTPNSLMGLLVLSEAHPLTTDLAPVDFDALDKMTATQRTAELENISMAQLFWRENTLPGMTRALQYVPEGQKGEIILKKMITWYLSVGKNKEQDDDKWHILQDLLFDILNALPEELRLEAMREQDNNGRNVLHLSTDKHNLGAMVTILNFYPYAQRLEAVKQQDKDEKTVLHWAAENNNVSAMNAILALYPSDSDRLVAIQSSDKEGETVLHLAANNKTSDAIDTLWNLYPTQALLLAAVKNKNGDGSTVLHCAAQKNTLQVMTTILNAYPDNTQRFNAVNEKDNDGETVLHLAARTNKNPDVMALLLSLYSPEELSKVIKEKDNDGDTLLHLAAQNKNPEILALILKHYPKEELFEVLSIKNSDDATIFNLGMTCSDLNVAAAHVTALLGSLPINQRLEFMKKKVDSTKIKEFGFNNLQLLMQIQSCAIIMHAIFSALSLPDCIELIKEKNNLGFSAIAMAIANNNQEAITTMLSILPQNDFLEVMKEKNQYGHTALHLATQIVDATTMTAILNAFPKNSLLKYLQEVTETVSGAGRSPLYNALKAPSVMTAILDALPEKQSLELIFSNIDIMYCDNFTHFESILLHTAEMLNQQNKILNKDFPIEEIKNSIMLARSLGELRAELTKMKPFFLAIQQQEVISKTSKQSGNIMQQAAIKDALNKNNKADDDSKPDSSYTIM